MANPGAGNIAAEGGFTKYNNMFCWEPIWFKVEDELFCVPRSGFAEAKDSVFDNMFSAPTSGVPVEGRDKEHPIGLEDSKKDVICLLKYMYPTITHFVVKTKTVDIQLKKEEWISVLKLATKWDMTDIRKTAIQSLSGSLYVLTSTEKLSLGREFRVRDWVAEGIKALAQDINVRLVQLRVHGWETAAQILDIRSQSAYQDSGRYGYNRSAVYIDAETVTQLTESVFAAELKEYEQA
ncbi:hypothetical protein FA15DRAFT_673152 [Coprinopsis marcescibilis]|uniref:BTB domain-containing protein n=1 Tax=Coprinopsis marcescibilis TaxID=230819 RepID=A0A5C3KLJ2_COPMA|nr:hypothetical protein FA15DRAFT_673152 [Coprinopsis marcescibilis]